MMVAAAPSALARFWAAALRWELRPPSDDGVIEVAPTDATSFHLELRPMTGIRTIEKVARTRSTSI